MTNTSSGLADVARLIGEPARSRMLLAMMDGRARTATELALDGDVAPSTASVHLGRLTRAGVTELVKQGRHRYFRLAGPEIAAAIESLLGAAQAIAPRHFGTTDDDLRRARVCYDHFAGRVSVAWFENMLVRGHLRADQGLALTESGERWCRDFGLDLVALRTAKRLLCRPCLDWTERREHLAGALGAAFLARLFVLGYARRLPDSRAIALSPRGERFLTTLE